MDLFHTLLQDKNNVLIAIFVALISLFGLILKYKTYSSKNVFLKIKNLKKKQNEFYQSLYDEFLIKSIFNIHLTKKAQKVFMFIRKKTEKRFTSQDLINTSNILFSKNGYLKHPTFLELSIIFFVIVLFALDLATIYLFVDILSLQEDNLELSIILYMAIFIYVVLLLFLIRTIKQILLANRIRVYLSGKSLFDIRFNFNSANYYLKFFYVYLVDTMVLFLISILIYISSEVFDEFLLSIVGHEVLKSYIVHVAITILIVLLFVVNVTVNKKILGKPLNKVLNFISKRLSQFFYSLSVGVAAFFLIIIVLYGNYNHDDIDLMAIIIVAFLSLFYSLLLKKDSFYKS